MKREGGKERLDSRKASIRLHRKISHPPSLFPSLVPSCQICRRAGLSCKACCRFREQNLAPRVRRFPRSLFPTFHFPTASAMSDNQAAPSTDAGDALTNTLRPLTDCFLTVRIIKSFEYRTTKNLLLPHVDVTTMTVGQLKDTCRERESTHLCAHLRRVANEGLTLLIDQQNQRSRRRQASSPSGRVLWVSHR